MPTEGCKNGWSQKDVKMDDHSKDEKMDGPRRMRKVMVTEL